MLAVTDAGPRAVLQLPHCTKAPPRDQVSAGQAAHGGCLPRPWPYHRAVSTTRIGTFSHSHTKMRHIQMNSPGLLTKGSLGTHHWSDCETVNESARPLPLGNTRVTYNELHLRQRASSDSAKPHPWLASGRERYRCAGLVTHRADTYLMLARAEHQAFPFIQSLV